MVLATRCPHCETVFRLQDAQLARSRSRVRCGNCHEVFDASQNLLDPGAAHPVDEEQPHKQPAWHAPEPVGAEPPAPPAFEAPPAAAQAFGSPTPDEQPAAAREREMPAFARPPVDDLREPTLSAPIAPEAGPAPTRAAEHPGSVDVERNAPAPHIAPGTHAGGGEPAATPLHEEPTLAPELAPASVSRPDPEPRFRERPEEPAPFSAQPATFDASATAPADDRVHFAVTRERRARTPRHAIWRFLGVLATLVLLILLAAQLAWWQREAVMVYWPDSQPIFAKACSQLGCRLSVPRDIEGLQVEASDLRQIDGPHRLELRVPLRNRYNVALAYPAIELTLFDARNEVAIRRVLWPQDYVSPGTPIAAGLPPRTTQTMIVHLDSGNAVATNFRVQIFYP
ncbi:DUF3426 domain-containing protein [Trinickia caryophylli]|uniref:MJ0042 family finger-like domain-containing protein n=1 Tax=Trinickia caryophylli TaxID=28094 RepID=A0A1X7C9S2_TRICW|nr:DUF3426 domain-containing protein [Trinickia caryophylli]PMS09345.1 DUF3426 domain-containing protein [Trinickia caryophylli]TRX19603.1 DUF3426 domain-containing protein [Trinickia caryophylli]WQE13085.1 DUF3426 domain-containing protein [Trinickia caryophylli]SME92604.1 MJ0042 family finger-like domain-containing protein [Trinickia caryophylli]GLU30825.1 hypothetical protein Busp01_06670 [Trinickia caryophylli]